MQSTRQFHLKGIALKIATIAFAAAAVYAADTLPDRASLREARAASPAVTAEAPPIAAVAVAEVWSADESASGTRPDAAH